MNSQESAECIQQRHQSDSVLHMKKSHWMKSAILFNTSTSSDWRQSSQFIRNHWMNWMNLQKKSNRRSLCASSEYLHW